MIHRANASSIVKRVRRCWLVAYVDSYISHDLSFHLPIHSPTPFLSFVVCLLSAVLALRLLALNVYCMPYIRLFVQKTHRE